MSSVSTSQKSLSTTTGAKALNGHTTSSSNGTADLSVKTSPSAYEKGTHYHDSPSTGYDGHVDHGYEKPKPIHYDTYKKPTDCDSDVYEKYKQSTSCETSICITEEQKHILRQGTCSLGDALSQVPWMKFRLIAEPNMDCFSSDIRLRTFIRQVTELTVSIVNKQCTDEIAILVAILVANLKSSMEVRIKLIVETIIEQIASLCLEDTMSACLNLDEIKEKVCYPKHHDHPDKHHHPHSPHDTYGADKPRYDEPKYPHGTYGADKPKDYPKPPTDSYNDKPKPPTGYTDKPKPPTDSYNDKPKPPTGYTDKPKPPTDSYNDKPKPPTVYTDKPKPPTDSYNDKPKPPTGYTDKPKPPTDSYNDKPKPPTGYTDKPKPPTDGYSGKPPTDGYKDTPRPPSYSDTPKPPANYNDKPKSPSYDKPKPPTDTYDKPKPPADNCHPDSSKPGDKKPETPIKKPTAGKSTPVPGGKS